MKTRTTVGRVSSIDDPAKAGRIRVSIKEMDGNTYPEWVSPSLTPGWVAMPSVGDSVEVEIPDGEDMVEFSEEVRYRGQVLDGSSPVPDDFKNNYPKRRGFQTPGGHFIMFDDTSGQDEVTIAYKGRLLVSLTKDGIFLGTQQSTERVALGTRILG
jgi:hypothetical protein